MNNASLHEGMTLWKEVSVATWTDWRWQMAHRLMNRNDLRIFVEDEDTSGEILTACLRRFRWAVTPFWADRLMRRERGDPLWAQAIPSAREGEERPHLKKDPLGEEKDSPVPGIVHRYPDRALMLLTNRCAVYCRHCNRRRRAAGPERDASSAEIERMIEYLQGHPEIREVILSGGDPLLWSDKRLEQLLMRLRRISTLEIIRISTRLPVVLPFRITPALCHLLKRGQPLYLHIHVNHPAELSDEMNVACGLLADAGIPLGSQTVLLKGVNDDVKVLQTLFLNLLRMRIKPYALYHCDPAQGTAHFRTTLTAGRALMEELMKNTSGLAIPHYIADAPDGAGKIPIARDYITASIPGGVLLKNLWGKEVTYYYD